MPAALLLRVVDLEIAAFGPRGHLPLVQGVSFQLEANRVLGIIGESGCGKSLTCLSILGLLAGSLKRTRGEIYLHGSPVHDLPPQSLRRLRGRSVAVIMQNPMNCFDAIHTIRQHFQETLAAHDTRTNGLLVDRVVPLLREVGLENPESVLDLYPFQMSGGMLQRVMIALALLFEPSLLIADEPTTDLDAVSQARILDLLAALRARRGLGILLVTHDLGVLARLADDVAVMRDGVIVEAGRLAEVCATPRHPYTASLLEAHHSLDRTYRDRIRAWSNGDLRGDPVRCC